MDIPTEWEAVWRIVPTIMNHDRCAKGNGGSSSKPISEIRWERIRNQGPDVLRWNELDDWINEAQMFMYGYTNLDSIEQTRLRYLLILSRNVSNKTMYFSTGWIIESAFPLRNVLEPICILMKMGSNDTVGYELIMLPAEFN
jgi:hypothetical protein